MTDPSDPPKSFFQRLFLVAVITTVFSLPVVGLLWWANSWEDGAELLDRDGVTTVATISEVEEWTERRADTSGKNRRGGGTKYTRVAYQFTTNKDQTIDSEYTSLDLAATPAVGDEFEVRYAASDPSVHEANAGHMQRNTDALRIIACFFGGLFLLIGLPAVALVAWVLLDPEEQTDDEK